MGDPGLALQVTLFHIFIDQQLPQLLITDSHVGTSLQVLEKTYNVLQISDPGHTAGLENQSFESFFTSALFWKKDIP
jgi:hypothetical protein